MTEDKAKKAAKAVKNAAEEHQQSADKLVVDTHNTAADANINTNDFDGEFSLKRSLFLAVFLPIGVIVGWLIVSATGGLGYESKQKAADAVTAKSSQPTVDPVAEEARRVASETAERVARRVSTDVATKVARDVASKVARDTALKAIESVN